MSKRERCPNCGAPVKSYNDGFRDGYRMAIEMAIRKLLKLQDNKKGGQRS